MPETQEELLEAGADAGGRTNEMSLFNMQKQTHRLARVKSKDGPTNPKQKQGPQNR